MKTTPDQMRTILRKACETAGSQRQWASKHAFSEQYVCDILLGRREISEQIAKALGYKRIISFRQLDTRLKALEDR